MTGTRASGVRTATAVAAVAGAVLVTIGLVVGTLTTIAVGVALPVVAAWVGGPLMRWLHRGEGPYAVRSAAEAEREAYVRMRYSGGHSHGL